MTGVQTTQFFPVQVSHPTFAVGGAVHGGVVNHYETAVLAGMNIDFHGLDPHIQGPADGAQGIFRFIGLRSPVSHYLGHIHLFLINGHGYG